MLWGQLNEDAKSILHTLTKKFDNICLVKEHYNNDDSQCWGREVKESGNDLINSAVIKKGK